MRFNPLNRQIKANDNTCWDRKMDLMLEFKKTLDPKRWISYRVWDMSVQVCKEIYWVHQQSQQEEKVVI